MLTRCIYCAVSDNMKPVNIFAVVELSIVLVILCGNLCCACLHPYRYIRMGYRVRRCFSSDNDKSARRDANTARAGCSKAEPKNFAPLQTPFPGAQNGQNLISWRWLLPSPTDPVWWDRCTQFRVIVLTDPSTHPQAHKQTDRTDYNTRRRS